MYHEIHEGEAHVEVSLGAARYHIARDAFRAHLEAIRESGVALKTVGDWVAGRAAAPHVVLTFDDGWAGSLSIGVESLAEAGMRATFFVTRDFVGTRHFADAGLLRAAHAAGMEIGTHGATHRFLSECPEEVIRAELVDSKAFLEDILGAAVETGSVPGGAWSPLVGRVARESGYSALCTSRPGRNGEAADAMRLRRVVIRQDTTADAVLRYSGGSVGREVVRAAALELPRTILGRERYARLRARLLGDRTPTLRRPSDHG